MEKNYLPIPYYIVSVEQHSNIKKELLTYIDQAEFQSCDEITKTDFHLKKQQDYQRFVIPYILNAIRNVFQNSQIKILDCWFQQYQKYSFHPFHSHECEWACVYYVDLPAGSKGTVFKDYVSNTEIKTAVVEGDVLIFPGWIKHKSPPNKGSDTKSIVALNFEITA